MQTLPSALTGEIEVAPMLPSFRLIAATFLCGFFVVFAGLRLAASLNDIHEGLPVMAAHAAPVSITPVADREARRGLAAVPVMYDLRFAVSTVAPTLVRVPPTVLDRPAPPLSIVPPDAFDREGSLDAAPEAEAAKDATEPAEPEATVAAIPPAAPVIPGSAVVPDAPAEQPAPEAPAVAAIDSRATPNTTAEHRRRASAAQTPAPVTQAAANEPQATPAPAIEESPPNPEAAAAPAETPAAPATGPEPKPRSPAAALPAPKPQAAKPQAAKSSPRSRVKVARKKLFVSPAAPRRRTAWRTPSAVRTAPSPPCPASRSADLACHPSWQKRKRRANCVP